MHGDVRSNDLLPTEVLDLGVEVDILARNVTGAVEAQSAGHRTRRAAAAATAAAASATGNRFILSQLYAFLKQHKSVGTVV